MLIILLLFSINVCKVLFESSKNIFYGKNILIFEIHRVVWKVNVLVHLQICVVKIFNNNTFSSVYSHILLMLLLTSNILTILLFIHGFIFHCGCPEYVQCLVIIIIIIIIIESLKYGLIIQKFGINRCLLYTSRCV